MFRPFPAVALLLACLAFTACGESGPGPGPESGPTIDPDSPRAAFEAYRAAMRDGDLDVLNGVLAAEAREGMAGAEPELVLTMLRSFLPSEETVVGTEIDGDAARIRLTSADDPDAKGSIRLVREDGNWKVAKESWNMSGGEPEPSDAPDIPDREPDGDWRLDCNELSITDLPAAGRIGGMPMTVRYAQIQNNILTLTDGDRFRWNGQFIVFLFLNGDDKTLAGRTISIGPEKDWDAEVSAHVHYGYKSEDAGTEMEAKTDGFSIRIEFGSETDGKLPGKIHLSYPDEKKSFLVGSFTAILE